MSGDALAYRSDMTSAPRPNLQPRSGRGDAVSRRAASGSVRRALAAAAAVAASLMLAACAAPPARAALERLRSGGAP